jgi:FkbM family methyltransferase
MLTGFLKWAEKERTGYRARTDPEKDGTAGTFCSFRNQFIQSINNPFMMPGKVRKILRNPVFWTWYAVLLGMKFFFDRSLAGKKLLRKNNLNFDLDLDLSPFCHDMYFGLYEMEITRLMNHFLRPGDSFVDIGANIGYFTWIGAGLVTAKGQVHSFEPVFGYFGRLQSLKDLNPGFPFTFNNIALGSSAGTLRMYVNNANIGNNTLVKNFIAADEIKNEIEVGVKTFDQYAGSCAIGSVRLIKIDVEGFEFEVLKGMDRFLRSAGNSPVIICELNPAIYPDLGYTSRDLLEFMADHGYTPRDLLDPEKKLTPEECDVRRDAVFVPEQGTGLPS